MTETVWIVMELVDMSYAVLEVCATEARAKARIAKEYIDARAAGYAPAKDWTGRAPYIIVDFEVQP